MTSCSGGTVSSRRAYSRFCDGKRPQDVSVFIGRSICPSSAGHSLSRIAGR